MEVKERRQGEKPKIVVVCGYGMEPNDGYNKYLGKTRKWLLSLQAQGLLDRIITCGGYTNPKYPGLSEAEFVAQCLNPTVKVLTPEICNSKNYIRTDILEEKVSTTTPQNLAYGLMIGATVAKLSDHEIIFVCDDVRRWKVAVQAAILTLNYLQKIDFRVQSFAREDSSLISTPKGQLVSFLAEIAILVANKGAVDAKIYHDKAIKPALAKLQQLFSQ